MMADSNQYQDQDISFELSDELLAKLRPIIEEAAGRKQLLICSVRKGEGARRGRSLCSTQSSTTPGTSRGTDPWSPPL